MAWCKLEDSFRDHRKPKRLAKLLGISHAEARGLCAGLWSWALTQAPDGDLRDFSTDEIEDAADWGGEPGALIDALASDGVGLLDLRGDEYEIHEYLERAESYKKATAKRVERDRKKAEAAAVETVAVQSSDCRETVSPRGEERRGDETKGEEQRGSGVAPVSLKSRSRRPGVEQVAECYCQTYPKNRAQAYRPENQDLIAARLADHTPDDLCRAIDGMRRGDGEWYFRKGHTELSRAMRDEESVGKFMALADAADAPVLTDKSRQTIDAVKNWTRKAMEEDDQK